MDCIIKTESNGYFCGWDMFGQMKFIGEKRLAYRMRPAVARTTADKIIATLHEACSILTI